MPATAPGNRARRNLKMLAYGTAIGFLYGLAFRMAVRFQPETFLRVMLLGFLVFVPLAMGFISVFVAESKQPQPIWIWPLLPWLPVTAMVVAFMALLWEGLICVILFLPMGLIVSTIGGVLGGLTARLVRSRRSRNTSLACVVLLPLLIAPWEERVFHRYDLRTVDNVIDIHAPAEIVWRNIERVPRIRPDELPSSWSQRIGLPDPVEATLSQEGVGAVRHGFFTQGVSFIETVNVWEPERRLAFSIQAGQIPTTALDEHVRVGGAYFDVLHGEYRLESLANGVIRLHFSSQHRVSTDFNWYAHLWTDAVMSNFQQRILYVVRQRSESAAKERLP